MEYSKFSVKELKSILDKKGFKGYSKYRKDELINLLSQMEDIEEEERVENEETTKEEKQENSSVKEAEENDEKKIKDEITSEENEIIQNTIEEIIEEESEGKVEENSNQKIEIPELPQKIEEVKKKEGLISSQNPVSFLEHVRSGIGNLTSDKKSDILKSIVEYKTVQKMQEHQRLQDEFNKLHTRCEFLQEEINYLKNYTKEVRESFLMSMMIIMHNFSFLPLEKLPIFKKK